MPTTELIFRISDDGTITVLDKAGGKLDEVADKAEKAEGATASLGTAGGASLRALATGASAAQLALGGVAVAGTAAAAAVAASVQANLNRAEQLNILASTAGLTVRELSSLELVARRNQTEISALAGGVQALNISLGQASNGAGRDAAVMRALGVEVRSIDGAIRPALPVIYDLADAFQGLPEGVDKSAAAQVLFAGTSDEMLRAMRGGSAGIRQATADAERLGLVMGDKVAADAQRVNDNLGRAKDAAYGFGLSLGQPFLDVIGDATGAIADLAEEANEAARVDPTGFWDRMKKGALESIPVIRDLVGLVGILANLPNWAYQGKGAFAAGVDPSTVLPSGIGPQAKPAFDIVDRNSPEFAAYQAKQRELAAALGRTNRSGAGDAERLADLTDKSLQGSAQAKVQNAQIGVTLAQEELRIFEQRLALENVFVTTQSERLALLQASEQQEIALARDVDLAQQSVLAAQVRVLEAKKLDHDVVEATKQGLTGQVDLIDAQIGQLEVQQRLIQGTGGEAAKVANEYARARAELEASNRVIVNLGDATNSGLQRAVDGIFNSGGNGGLDTVVADTGKAIGSSLVGGFIEAELKKREFDQMIGKNFTVTLPGFMQTGADKIGDIWGGLMESLGFEAQEAGDKVGRSISDGYQQAGGAATGYANTVAALARNTGYASSVVGIDDSGRYIVENEFGQRFSGPDQAATTAAAGGTGGTGAGAGAGGAGAALAGAAGGLLVAIQATVAAFEAIDKLKDTVSLRNIITDQDVLEAGARGAFGSVGLGGIGGLYAGIPKGARTAINTAFNPLGNLFEIAGILQAPSFGAQRKEGLQKLIDKRLLPQQQDFGLGGHRGVRTQFLEALPDEAAAAAFAAAGFGSGVPGLRQSPLTALETQTQSNREIKALREDLQASAAARPEVEALRANESLALGTLLTGSLAGGSNVANALTNNLLLLNVSAGEAKRQLRALADTAGITLPNAVEEAQRLFAEGIFKDDPTTAVNEKALQLVTTIEGVVAIYEDDLPAGVDVAALAMANFTDEAGVDIAAFNKDLERAVNILGRLQEATRGGLRGGLDVGLQGLADRNTLIGSGGSVTDIIAAQVKGKRDLVSGLFDGVRTGMTTAITDGLQDAIQDTPEWDAVEEAIAAAVKGGVGFGDIPGLLGDVLDASLPQIEAAAAAVAEVNKRFALTPTALTGDADAIRDAVEGRRFDALNPRQQETKLRSDLAEIDARLAQLKVGGITPEETAEAAELARKRAQVGFQLGDLGEQRYADGSAAERRAMEEGNRIAEESAKLLTELAKVQQDQINHQAANTTALDRNTEALNNFRNREFDPTSGPNTQARHRGRGGPVVIIDADRERVWEIVDEGIANERLSPASRQSLSRLARGRG